MYISYFLFFFTYEKANFTKFTLGVCVCMCVCVFLLLSFAWCDVERGSRWSQGLWEQVHPHHQTALTDSTNDQSQNTNGRRQNTNRKPPRQVVVETKGTHTCIRSCWVCVTCSISGCSGLYSGLVSTCSGTNPIFLKMWRDSRSLIGPRWCLHTFLSSEKTKHTHTRHMKQPIEV